MIRVQLKQRFDAKSKAVQFLMSIISPGDESYFEFVGKKKKGTVEDDADATLNIEMASMGLTTK